MTQQQIDRLIAQYDQHCRRIERCASIDIHESVHDKLARMARLESDYGLWFEYYFPEYASARCADFHIEISNDICNNPVFKSLLDMFRGSAKSVHATLGIPLFLALVKKQLKFGLIIGANEEKAVLLLSCLQATLKHNQRIINDYGTQHQAGNWEEGNFTTTAGVHFHALGFGQDPRGARSEQNRPDYIVCDDIDTMKRCNNQRLIREAVEYVTSSLWGCFDKGFERFVFCNNNIHKNSIMANLIKLSEQANIVSRSAGKRSQFKHYHVEAVIDDEYTPSWPQKYTADYWRDKRANTNMRSWQREYLCRPIAEGAIFNPQWIQYKRMLPLAAYDALVVYGDLSYKDKGDYKAMVFVGKLGREFHLIHAFVRQTSRAACARWLYDLNDQIGLLKFNVQYYIEGLFAQDEFVNDFDTEGDERAYYMPIVPDKEPKINKFDRIESMSGFFERGNVWFNEIEKSGTDTITIVDQLLAFEKGSTANDDGPDALQSAISKLNTNTRIERFEPRIVSRNSIKKNRY